MASVQPNQGMPQQQQQGNAVINQVLPAGMTGEQVKAMFQVGSDIANVYVTGYILMHKNRSIRPSESKVYRIQILT